MNSHIVVTGGAGFVGSHVALRLKSAFPSVPVTAFDNLHRRGSELNLPALRRAGVQFVHGDIRIPDDLAGLEPAPGLVVECSAEPSAQAGYGGSPEYLIHSNLTGCFNCLELARKAGAAFLFISTSRVYPFHRLNGLACREEATRFVLEDAQDVPGASSRGISETFPLSGARSLYGMTKLAAELMIEEYGDAFGLRYIINRAGLLTGPRQMAKSDQGVIALWAAAHYFGKPLSYIGFGGTGKQVRDFLHIEDFCDLLLMQIQEFSAYQGRCWNVGGGAGNSLSLLEMTQLCRELTGKEIPLSASPDTRPADVRAYITDYSALAARSGWRPRRGARETLQSIMDWLVQDEERLWGLLF
jgi:CDP-paratose 2-epimerase